MSIVSLPQDTSGQQTSADCRSELSAEQAALPPHRERDAVCRAVGGFPPRDLIAQVHGAQTPMSRSSF